MRVGSSRPSVKERRHWVPMDKETRNRIERATQSARGLLEQDFADQLEGVFDIRLDGTLATEPGSHLDAAQPLLRRKLVAAVEHNRASGQKAPEAVATYLREAAFTTLNRFVALKMLEARGLVQECISRGEQSAGFKEFCGLAPGLVQLPDHGYRLYIESLFDELSTEVKVLFDRRDPHSALWPRRATFEQLLETLNATDLASVWGEEETIGWVYQFFNDPDERRKMREESQAPRNSREQPVLYAALRRPVPHRQHARAHLVRDAGDQDRARRAVRVHGPQTR
jgi:hypothetical protein